MFNKILPVLFILVISVSSFTQNAGNKAEKKPETPAVETKTEAKTETKTPESKAQEKDEYPIQAIKTNEFNFESLTFSRKIDPQGRGELLLVEFALTANTDYKWKLYIHVIASVEHEKWGTNTLGLKKILLNGSVTDLFVPYPKTADNKNFEYQIDGQTKLLKLPHDYKTGVNPITNSAYVLDKYLPVMTQHLDPYSKKFKYFNYVTILVYDDEGKLMFKQIYNLNRFRR